MASDVPVGVEGRARPGGIEFRLLISASRRFMFWFCVIAAGAAVAEAVPTVG